MSDFTDLKSYKKLQKLAKKPIDLTKNILNTERINKYKLNIENFKLLYATERVDEEVMDSLSSLAVESGAIEKMKKMQNGEVINKIEGCDSENRTVLHTAMRDIFENRNQSPSAKKASDLALEEINKLEAFINKINSDKKFTNIVQIGIGGSFLGPKALYEALKIYKSCEKNVYFIANVDPDDLNAVLLNLDLSKTLFVTVSKSGTTLETFANEEIVKKLLKEKQLEPKDHMVAVTGKNSPMDDKSKYLESFYIWDYVGGRYSATSMVGAVILSFAFGMDKFKDILRGANAMDKIALKEDIKANLPLFSALLGIWNHNFLNHPTYAVIPYCSSLFYLLLHLQQCDMESNGKQITKAAKEVNFKTGAVLFGDVGTNAQHSFYQLLHQGTEIVPLELIGFKNSQYNKDEMVKNSFSQEKLLSNLFAQSIALAIGQNDKNPNKVFHGNRPNHILLLEKLDPFTVGALLAYFEHKVAFQGFIWNINSFDQEGVQLGKKLADKIIQGFISKREGKPIEFDLAKAFIDELDQIG